MGIFDCIASALTSAESGNMPAAITAGLGNTSLGGLPATRDASCPSFRPQCVSAATACRHGAPGNTRCATVALAAYRGVGGRRLQIPSALPPQLRI